MVSTFTPNLQLEKPANNDQSGTWDVPVNSNATVMDLVTGGNYTITVGTSNITLASSMFRNNRLTIVSTLQNSISVIFPSSFTKSYEIQNLTTNSTQFFLALQVSGGVKYVSAPPGQITEVINDGSNIIFKNFPPIGSYVHYSGAGVPLWAQNCGVLGVGNMGLPYLNCDGSTFSSSTYPVLNTILGGTTLPDWRGRMGATVNQGTGRITVGGCGLDGNTLFVGGGDQNTQSHTHSGGVTGVENQAHNHNFVELPSAGNIGGAGVAGGGGSQFGSGPISNANATTGTESAAHSHTYTTNNTFSGGAQNMPPTLIYGITMIRAA